MTYRWHCRDSVEANLTRIARQQVDGAMSSCAGAAADPVAAVHDIRKRCKKVRSLLRLCRGALGPVYPFENAGFRDLARRLSPMRDSQALAAVALALVEHVGTARDQADFRPWTDRVAAYFGSTDSAPLTAELEHVGTALRDARRRIDGWKVSGDGFRAVEPGLRRTYRRGQRAMRAAQRRETVDAYHSWRKRAKDYWYHTRLLQSLWPEAMRAARCEAHRLAAALGDEHDLAVLERALMDCRIDPPDDAGGERLLGLIAARRLELRRAADWYGVRLYAESPRAFARRIGEYWRCDGGSA